MSYRIFLSFSEKDRRVADAIRKHIAKAGATVLSSESSLGSGLSIDITDEIRQSDEVVVVVSKNSVQSSWLGFEIGVASGLGKKLIPVLVGVRASEMPPVLKSIQSIDWHNFQRYLAELATRVRENI